MSRLDDAKTYLTCSKNVTSYRATWAVGGEGNSWIPYQNTGLVIIDNNKITFLELQIPQVGEKKIGPANGRAILIK